MRVWEPTYINLCYLYYAYMIIFVIDLPIWWIKFHRKYKFYGNHVSLLFSWRVHAVGECSARCREKGLAVRDVRCTKLSNDGKRSATYVSDEHCRHLDSGRPDTTVECIGSCKATRWLYSAWSEVGCSGKCLTVFMQPLFSVEIG